jgi:catechol 2,3-dioxygenase
MSTTTTRFDSGPAAGAAFDAGETIAHGAVHLDVTDLPRALAFWRDLLGLAQLEGEADGVARLGAGGRELIVLHAGAERPPQRGHSGLYHVALHLPDAREFARVIARLAAARYPQAPTDHIFSQATYLDDPDGIGLELTLETPERVAEMSVRGEEFRIVDTEGRLRRPVEPLDTEAVFSRLGDAALDEPLPAGTKLGHVHLHVGDLDVANAFYRDQLGFEEHTFLLLGMADLHTGGRFPHRMALNVWQGEGAPQPPAGTAGLRHFTIVAREAAGLAAIRNRLEAAGVDLEADGDALFARDPSGNRFQLAAA